MKKSISQLVAQVESNNVPWVMRYEPHFKPSAVAINNCIRAHAPGYMNRTTAEMICKTSWGLFQIMGENLYTVCKYQGSVSNLCTDELLQETLFQAFIKARKIDFTSTEIMGDIQKLHLFSKRYNGSLLYAEKLVKAYNE